MKVHPAARSDTDSENMKTVVCCFRNCVVHIQNNCHRPSECGVHVYSGSILGAYIMYGKRSGSMRLVHGAFGMNIWRCWVPYAFRTPRMDLEHDECFPNVFSIVRKEFGPFQVDSPCSESILKPY